MESILNRFQNAYYIGKYFIEILKYWNIENIEYLANVEWFLKSLTMNWIQMLLEDRKSAWSLLVPSKMQNKFIWNYGTVALQKVLSGIGHPFWRDVIIAWISFSHAFSLPDELLCNENIFNSDATKFKDIRYFSWERKGVKFIGDLLEDGHLMTWQRFKGKF